MKETHTTSHQTRYFHQDDVLYIALSIVTYHICKEYTMAQCFKSIL